MTTAILLILTALNLWTFLCFWQDKARAVGGRRRIAERDLLMLALIGGSPAAFAARRMFRHKTRKEPFSSWLKLIAGAQVAAVLAWLALG